MSITRVSAAVAILSASGILLAGCAPSVPYVSEIIEGTELFVAWSDTVSDFNGNTVAGSEPANRDLLHLTTAQFNYRDGNFGLVTNPAFGRYEKLGDDPLTVRYTVNGNVTWSDGVAVDGADLLLAWASSFAGAGSGTAPLFEHAAPLTGLATAIPTVDNNSLTIVFDEPRADWEELFQLGVSAHGTVQLAYPAITDAESAKRQFVAAIQENDLAWLRPVAAAWNNAYVAENLADNAQLSLSSGPYVVESLVEDSHVTFVSNDLFAWGPSPRYERITFRKYAGNSEVLEAFTSGEIQVAFASLTPELRQLVDELPDAQSATFDELSYEHVDLTFDNGGPFDAVTYGGDEQVAATVRRAFLLSIPRQAILGQQVLPVNPDAGLRDSFLAHPDSADYEEMVLSNGSAAFAAADIDTAVAMLQDAGVPSGVVVRFWYPLGDERRAAEFELIQQSAARAGFHVVNTAEPYWEFLDRAVYPVNPHDAVIFAWQPSNASVTGVREYLVAGGPSNFSGYANPEVERLLDEIEGTLNADAVALLSIELEKTLWADGYGIPLYQYPALAWWDRTVSGISPSAVASNRLWNYWEWSPPVPAGQNAD